MKYTPFLLVVLIIGMGCASVTDWTPDDATDATIAWPEGDVGAYLAATANHVEGFETGDLAGFGAADSWVVGETETGIARIVSQGEDFSIRSAEERITLAGGHALALQVTEAGGAATLTTEPFVPSAPHVLFAQLSEVDHRGIVLLVQVIDDVDTDVYEIPVVTGGHRPGLTDDAETLPGFPEVGWDDGTPGEFSWLALDLTHHFLAGREVQLRFVQRSMVAPFDFFTLLDDLCQVEVPVAWQDEIAVYKPIRDI
jgi:hypothetical protein